VSDVHQSFGPLRDNNTTEALYPSAVNLSTPNFSGADGRHLILQGALTEAKPGNAGQKMVFIEPSGPRGIAWLKAAAYGLSLREREVVDLVLRGASRKQMAATLYISEYTVQDHLCNIFDKVGVEAEKVS
jgi:hypothetical protein